MNKKAPEITESLQDLKVMKRFFAIFSVIMLLLSCQVSKKDEIQHPKGFVKLEKSLQETLLEITFDVIWLSDEGSDEVIFQGAGVSLEGEYIRMDRKAYTLYASQAIETNRYIFVPIAAHGGGSGVFWDLNIVDKKTLRTVDEVSLGDRVWIIEVFELDSHPDAVGISYIRRDVESEVIYDLSKMITQHFRMVEDKLEEIREP